jgi:16S rRNA (guanine966-N2)-methyltransferase
MRIIAGKYKGRQLLNFKETHIRPMSDRVKESVFNILRDEIDGARILDLFSGTGSIALEALSRGASQATLVEKSSKSLDIIRKNIESLNIQNVRLIQSDVLKYLRNYEGTEIDVVFIDPPFTEKMGHQVLQIIKDSAVLGTQTIVLIETSAHERIDDVYGNLKRFDTRSFGDKIISFFQLESNE